MKGLWWLDTPYNVVLADPPWQYKAWRGDMGKRTADSFYETMKVGDIAGLLRGPLNALPIAKDAALFLWATPPALAEAMHVMKEWGFKYKTFAFTWVKQNPSGSYFTGMGHYTRANAEICLLGTRGRPVVQAHNVRQIIVSQRREHSRKPDEQYEKIEALFKGPYIELFARHKRPGWHVWGAEAPE